MLKQLKAKPGSEHIRTMEEDFATTTMGDTYSLVFLEFNTINNLTVQDEQVACMENAARHLIPGGYFVIEVGVPELRSLPPGQNLRAFHLGENRWGINEYHFATQDFTSHHMAVRDGHLRRSSIPSRYVFPEELDLMARIAGTKSAGCWAGWRTSPSPTTAPATCRYGKNTRTDPRIETTGIMRTLVRGSWSRHHRVPLQSTFAISTG